MSKRGQTIISGDFVETPFSAVQPLLCALSPGTKYTELCCGDGALNRHLAAAGQICREAHDVKPRPLSSGEMADAAKRVPQFLSITNPPHSRAALMPILMAAVTWPHPPWWLLPWDKLANKYFGSVACFTHGVIPLGRVSWLQNGRGAFENYCGSCSLTSLRNSWKRDQDNG